ncbi:MAG: PD40 domain-containing protein [Bryobacteraceae bacterium]|nr:PD40 domain-containing protein [Bryobacteraceae bacterium]
MSDLTNGGGQPEPLSASDREAARKHLERILASPEFAHAERLSRLLRYLVERKLTQVPNAPKEHEVALDVFDRGDSFDSRLDAIVRVHANRLRSKLAEYYQNGGGDDTLTIEIPAGHYSVNFRQRRKAPDTAGDAGGSGPPRERRRVTFPAPVMAAALGFAAVALWHTREPVIEPEPVLEPKPVTVYDGLESDPTLSPDGEYVAFTWDGEKHGNTDIWVQRLESSNPVRLTRDAAETFRPAWSPDGKWIAYLREAGPAAVELRLMTALGEPGPLVATLYGSADVAWMPDSRWLVVSDAGPQNGPNALFLLSPQTRETRRLTTPPANITGDFRPVVSSDGRNVAFVRANRLMVQKLSGVMAPVDRPRLVFSGDPAEVAGLAWAPDGRDIVLCGNAGSFEYRLWRVPMDGSGPPRRLSHAGVAGTRLAISRPGGAAGARLVYAREVFDSDIWRLKIDAAGQGSMAPLVASTRNDTGPQYSPDGKRIAFASDRSGDFEIWVCDADGSNQQQLTFMKRYTATPRWSPDGTKIAFDSNAKGQWEVFVIDANGGTPRQITNHPALDAIPSWSRDGKWIYFASDRTEENQVWKAPAGGGDAVQVTKDGGHVAFESFDGKLVYYTKTSKLDTALWSIPVDGGEEKEVLNSISYRGFFPVRDGIWFLSRVGRKTRIAFLSFADGKAKDVALASAAGNGLSVAPDGRSLLYASRRRIGADLMMVENFR